MAKNVSIILWSKKAHPKGLKHFESTLICAKKNDFQKIKAWLVCLRNKPFSSPCLFHCLTSSLFHISRDGMVDKTNLNSILIQAFLFNSISICGCCFETQILEGSWKSTRGERTEVGGRRAADRVIGQPRMQRLGINGRGNVQNAGVCDRGGRNHRAGTTVWQQVGGGDEEEWEMGVEKLTERRRELWGKLRIQANPEMKSGRDWQKDWYGSVEKSKIQSDKKRRRNAVYATTADASQAMIVLSSNRGSAVGMRTRTHFLRAADMKTVYSRGQTPTVYVYRCHAPSLLLCLFS